MNVKNISDGPKVLNTASAMILQPGQSADNVDLSEGELASAKASGWFEFDQSEAAAPTLEKMTKAELLDIAKTEGVEVEDKATKAEIIAAIEAKRAA